MPDVLDGEMLSRVRQVVAGLVAGQWHQDWAFYPHTNDGVLAIGIMLDDPTTFFERAA